MKQTQPLVPPSLRCCVRCAVSTTRVVLIPCRREFQVACRASPPKGWLAGAPLLGLVQDPSKAVLWAWGSAGVLRVRVAREERHVWRLHLEAGNFAAALSYCSPTDMAQRDSVLTAQADHVFKEGQYELAATQFAKTKQPVEDVAIKFAVASQGGALKTFLLHKLDSVEESDTAQLTMLCIWLTDIYLHILSSSANDVDAQELTTLEFREFLTDKHRCLHRATTYSLIAAHGRIRESLHFALVCSDWERALSLHIQLHQPEAALALLSDMLRGVSNSGLSILDSPLSSGAQVDEAQRLFEKFSPQLILLAPAQLVDVWLQAPKVEPAKLLPAIMSYEQRYEQGLEVLEHGRSAEEAGGHGKRTHHGIRYLQYCVDVMGCDDQAVCNCLLLLHIKHSEDAQLCDFLSGIRLAPDDTFAALGADAVLEADRSLRAAADDAAVTALAFGAGLRMLEPAYDPDYALRLCQECGRHKAFVVICQCRGMYAEAVDFALSQGRVDLAKNCTENLRVHSPQDVALRKALWLQAKSVVEICADAVMDEQYDDFRVESCLHRGNPSV